MFLSLTVCSMQGSSDVYTVGSKDQDDRHESADASATFLNNFAIDGELGICACTPKTELSTPCYSAAKRALGQC